MVLILVVVLLQMDVPFLERLVTLHVLGEGLSSFTP